MERGQLVELGGRQREIPLGRIPAILGREVPDRSLGAASRTRFGRVRLELQGDTHQQLLAWSFRVGRRGDRELFLKVA